MAGGTWSEPERAELLGECDGCRADPVELYQCDDDPGAWLYCWACAVARVDRARRARVEVGPFGFDG